MEKDPMKSITDYRNYRAFIQDYYEEKKRSSAFSWREFAKRAGFASGSYLKLVCDGHTRLTADGAEKTAAAMNLSHFEHHYFLLMVEYENAKDDAKRKRAFEEMLALAHANKVNVLGEDFYTYFESWKNPVLRELAPAMPGARPLEIAKNCLQEITAADVASSLVFLTYKGLLKRDRNGHYHQTRKSVSTGTMDVVPEAVRSMHHQMGGFALKALDELPMSERSFSGLTLGITKRNYNRILDELAECRRRIVAIATEDDDTDQVYRLNMQFFPLTKNLHLEGEEPKRNSAPEKSRRKKQ